jgi:hypothetical protein
MRIVHLLQKGNMMQKVPVKHVFHNRPHRSAGEAKKPPNDYLGNIRTD